MSTPSPGATQPPVNNGQQNSQDAVMQQLQAAAGVQTGGTPTTARQYGPLSTYEIRVNAGTTPGTQQISTGYSSIPVGQMALQYYTWDQKKKDQFRAKLGLINKNALQATDDDLAKTWADYVQQSANNFAAGITLTPDEILDKDVAARGAAASLAGTKTSTTSEVNLTSKVDSDAIFNSAAKSLLGRAPTPDEYAQFQASLNASERANPVNATTTTTTDAQGNVVSQNRQSTGGVGAGGAQLLAEQKAQQNPEYGAYQAATTYWNAAMQLINRGG
jgi:hypothetical protein